MPSERKSLLYFLSMYIFLVIIILLLVSALYYNFRKDLMFTQIRPKLAENAKDVIYRIKEMHQSLGADLHYPRFSGFKSAIYDADRVKIFSLLEEEDIRFDKVIYKTGDKIRFIKEPDAYYLGTKYLIIEVLDDERWLRETVRDILTFGGLFLIFTAFLGFFLAKLFIKPMRESFLLLDNFIKDTTHELNTPISAILANIETIDKNEINEKLAKKIHRIEIAARTISNIYQDMSYLLLNKKTVSNIERFDLKELLLQRISYFKILAQSKRVDFVLNIYEEVYIKADRKKMAKLIDNLISNAIKYNKIGGKIYITLKPRLMIIKDTGIGIPKDKINEIFKRYKRFNESEGGFGLGLNIVYMIAKEFGITIEIDSKPDKGTEVRLKW